MKKRITIVLTLTILISVAILPLLNYSYAIENLKIGEVTTNTSRVDKTKYPGIVERVEALKKLYPNWQFEFYKTGINWNDFVTAQYDPSRISSPRNLVSMSYKGEWICDYRGTKKYDNGSWYAASYHAIEYTADPRTYLNEFDIFSLKRVNNKSNDLSKDLSIKIIEDALRGRSYLKYKEDIYNVSKEENFDFVDVLARLIQEQGNGTVLSDGSKGTDGKIYYNPFNIAATGGSSSVIIANATKHAQTKGWDTFAKGLKGGIQLLKSNYEKQNTSYFEKFNSTTGKIADIWNQYMQNITAPFSEGSFKKSLYAKVDPNLKKSSYTFVIPLYENMQLAATRVPNHNTTTPNASMQPQIEPKLPAKAMVSDSDGLCLRKEANSSSALIEVCKAGTNISVLSKSSNYWYRVKVLSSGKIGYMARRVGRDPDYFAFIPEPTMKGVTKEYRLDINQDNPTLPRRAELVDDVYVRTGPSLSSSRIELLSSRTIINVIKKEKDANGYVWYKIEYQLNSLDKFNKTGYMARNEVNSKDYYYVFYEYIDLEKPTNIETPVPPVTPETPVPPTPKPPVELEKVLTNQKNPKLPVYAITNVAIKVRGTKGSTSSKVLRVLPAGTRIKVKSKTTTRDGYEWYLVYYNRKGNIYNNGGYIARNKVGSTNYYFKFTEGADWSKCKYIQSLKTTTPVKKPTTPVVSAYPRRATTTTALNVRRAKGSVYASRITTLPKGATISVRARATDRDGYTWYIIYYNLVNGKFQNSGYVSRNAIRSTNYYFRYI